ncbi:hypothetical protein FIBSPDRAFT_884846 [Athelia psychrophila]|uniref:Uncharacterized protein n=1 Tax=Athelia psychrophila TaxID=1759441 RepID=A0A166SG69_9AGAM|nr:hypothetical protein FIBSPDRAFT_884846 [Fibularhizoctonia sp. CBS 109695]
MDTGGGEEGKTEKEDVGGRAEQSRGAGQSRAEQGGKAEDRALERESEGAPDISYPPMVTARHPTAQSSGQEIRNSMLACCSKPYEPHVFIRRQSEGKGMHETSTAGEGAKYRASGRRGAAILGGQEKLRRHKTLSNFFKKLIRSWAERQRLPPTLRPSDPSAHLAFGCI